mmetsp:Transcript_72546/g.205953  ORF Transcript_72546/g.205953 Transcript_72546/m.205953 type:complete len:282 (-) Transcript_72546:16-861(-)
MDVLHGHLEAIEGPGFRDLDLGREAAREVLQHNAVRGCKKGQDVLDKMPFGVREPIPVLGILRQVNLLRRPEGGLVLLVHLPDLGVVDGEHDPPTRVLTQQRVLRLQLLLLRRDAAHVPPGTHSCAAQHRLQVCGQVHVEVPYHLQVCGEQRLVRKALDPVQGHEVLVLVGGRYAAAADAVRRGKRPGCIHAAVYADQDKEAAALVVAGGAVELLRGRRAGLAPGREQIQDHGQPGAAGELVQGRVAHAAVALQQLDGKVCRRTALEVQGRHCCLASASGR